MTDERGNRLGKVDEASIRADIDNPDVKLGKRNPKVGRKVLKTKALQAYIPPNRRVAIVLAGDNPQYGRYAGQQPSAGPVKHEFLRTDKNMFVVLRKGGPMTKESGNFGPQTGPWKGMKKRTESGLSFQDKKIDVEDIGESKLWPIYQK